jgi:hypothetical protein
LTVIGRRLAERGNGKIGTIIALVIAVVVVHSLIVYVPVRIANAEFGDFVEEQGRYLTLREITEERFIENILKEAEDNERVTLAEDDIAIEEGQRTLKVTIEHVETVKFLWGEKDLSFTIEKEIPKI